MKVTIIAVGKIKENYLKEGIKEYSKRLSRYCNLEIIEVPDQQAPDNLSPVQEEQVKIVEGDGILKKIKTGTIVVALDIKGMKLGSEDFADKINKLAISGSSHITFIIGGSLGLDHRITDMADIRLSLSDMTFPHQLTRLILLEQIYRVFKIINGETYHK
ncbi:MAG TPA: 23S rRNA (pseudouridine(1915)-N(3))-methyltransferase RlmH [Clostridiales bacterium]|nr:23S rRNA (pseudouridine(1915)-N(3))-methyltransferase RlmH [Clostridiales bacterium]